MKSFKFILFFVLISNISAIGQGYQTIHSKRIAYFENRNKNVNCIRIDSVKFQSDSILYPFAVIQLSDNQCYTHNASWIGKRIIVKASGQNSFCNKNNEVISINATAKRGDKWIAFRITDSLIIEATIIQHDTLTFLGLNDSVKTIAFQSYDKNMSPLNLEINEMNIKVSKHYGLIKTLNFYLFPGAPGFEEYDLIGLSNPKTGIQNLTWLEVNDFQVGDEIHVLEESSCMTVGSNFASTKKTIYKYLERSNHPDSIVYECARLESLYTVWTDSNSYSYYNDTLKIIIKPDTTFDKLPAEMIVTGLQAYHFYMMNESPTSKINYGYDDIYVVTKDSCWNLLIADGCSKQNQYIKGLGGPYYSCTHAFCIGGEERKLFYYKKGDITWGTPLVVTAIADFRFNDNLKIYPNPADHHINIRFDDFKITAYYIHLYDSQGILQKSMKLESGFSKMNIQDLFPGIYILKITDQEKILQMNKIVIK